jgi:excisionase family DNA binding protein
VPAENLAQVERMLTGCVSVAEILHYLQNDYFLTKTSAARFIDYHDERVIEQAIRAGQLRAYRINKKVLIKKSDLEAWVLRGEITRPAQTENKNDLQRLMDAAISKARANVAVRKTEQ